MASELDDTFFNVLAQALHESKSGASESIKKMAGWPDTYFMSDKSDLVDLLKTAATNSVTPEEEDGQT
jgi:hypothetical protein